MREVASRTAIHSSPLRSPRLIASITLSALPRLGSTNAT
jgi:hypothetical protein